MMHSRRPPARPPSDRQVRPPSRSDLRAGQTSEQVRPPRRTISHGGHRYTASPRRSDLSYLLPAAPSHAAGGVTPRPPAGQTSYATPPRTARAASPRMPCLPAARSRAAGIVTPRPPAGQTFPAAPPHTASGVTPRPSYLPAIPPRAAGIVAPPSPRPPQVRPPPPPPPRAAGGVA
jgi:hypothetical protein